jgi:glycosyltransferase involved in cell wall biosynthesis
MKIGMMSAWNQTSGVSTHAELVGKEWIKEGHKLKVFSFREDDFHGYSLIGQDEKWVTRCFGTQQMTNYLNSIPFLKEDFDFFVVQDLGMLPKDNLAKIFPLIRRKAKTILVSHTSKLPEDPAFYQFDWDAIVCFDYRYKNLLKQIFPAKKIHIIPFPCHRWQEGNQLEARKQLNLPLDKKIIFAFGQKWRHMLELIPALKELSKEYPILVLITSGAQRVYGFEEVNAEVRKEVLEEEEVYNYLHASDLMVFGKHSVKGAVLSSTVHFTLGSGCPIVARDSNFFEFIDKEVLKYRNLEEFKQKLRLVFDRDNKMGEIREAVKRFVEKNSAEKIAKQFIGLFKSL